MIVPVSYRERYLFWGEKKTFFFNVYNYSAKCHMTHASLHAAGRSDGYEHLLVILKSVTYTSCTRVQQVKEF